MIEPFNTKYLVPTKEFRCLSLLHALYEDPLISQKTLGRSTHLSSAMVNNYIKQFREDGLIKVTGDTNRNTRYHVTEAGHETLINLLHDYSAEIVQLYSAVKKEVTTILNSFTDEGIRDVVLFGAAETAEIVYSAIKETSLRVIGIIDNDTDKRGAKFNGFNISSPEMLNEMKFDAVIIASFGKQEEIYRSIKSVSGGRIIIKRLSDLYF
jgi:DNA-binding MarR family transcriptional regulator